MLPFNEGFISENVIAFHVLVAIFSTSSFKYLTNMGGGIKTKYHRYKRVSVGWVNSFRLSNFFFCLSKLRFLKNVWFGLFFLGWVFFFGPERQKKLLSLKEFTQPTETRLCLWYIVFMPRKKTQWTQSLTNKRTISSPKTYFLYAL